MTGQLHRLVALAVTLAPSRAVRLLGRLDDPSGADGVRLAEALAAAPRRTRLAALAAALPETGMAPRRSGGPGHGVHPLLQRLEQERREPMAAGRPQVRAATGPGRIPS